MPKINIMSKETAELISAGEVVERPASVVKELVENSIDAGATSIKVEIQNGGVTLIRVTDNGCGIERADVTTAFISHATSKLTTADDLDGISTLGFRGEALASVAAVARCELITKTADEPCGTRLFVEGGEFSETEDYGCPNGTIFVVKDLFYNTPARMKFLKKDVAEGNAVAGVIDRIALSHPEISFRFIRDGKQTLHTPGDGNLISCVNAVLGREIASAMINTEYSFNGVHVSGVISRPVSSRGNRTMQFFFINGRFVKTRTCQAALEQAYKNSIMVGRFPMCVLNVTLPYDQVDVNVHPAKTEVRFVSEKSVFDAVYYGAKSALTGGDIRPQIKLGDPFKSAQLQPAMPEQLRIVDKAAIKSTPQINIKNTFESSIPKVQPEEKMVFTSAVTEDKLSLKQPLSVEYRKEFKPIAPTVTKPQTPPAAEFVGDIKSSEADAVEEILQKPLSINMLGEAFDTYIFAQIDDSVYVIDKHAAHERMIYEKLRRDAQNYSQTLLSPVTLNLSKEEYNVLCDNTDVLNSAGFELDDFGGTSLILRRVPMNLGSDDIEGVITEIAERLLNHSTQVYTEKQDWIYHSVACRSAVKAGDESSPRELAELAARVLKEDIKYCPHGRPVAIVLTKKQLEKQFGRIQ